MLGLLRRLLSGQAKESNAASGKSGKPWYMGQDGDVTPERIEAARRRLKEKIPPPEGEEPRGAP